jgi:hypothetical protein
MSDKIILGDNSIQAWKKNKEICKQRRLRQMKRMDERTAELAKIFSSLTERKTWYKRLF